MPAASSTQPMKITRITATTVHVPIKVALVGAERASSMSACLVDIETDAGIVGHGFSAITDPPVIARIIDTVAAPEIIGDDPLAHERIWDKLYWTLMPRGQTGYAAHALAAIDVALWDIKGKHFKQPIWRLLGGARDRVPVYVTFGFDFFDRDQLAEAAKLWVKRGFSAAEDDRGPQRTRAARQKAAGWTSSARTRRACARCARRSVRMWKFSSTPIAVSISITRKNLRR